MIYNHNPQTVQDSYWMQKALDLAQQGQDLGEVPVGAVLIFADRIIGWGMNASIMHNDPTAHAEINALRCGGQNIANYRLLNTTLYVTLEPCLMCLAACVNARIKRLVFGAYDNKVGATTNFYAQCNRSFNHQIVIQGGMLAEQCQSLILEFFRAQRNNEALIR